MKFKDKVVLVTGAGRGHGCEIAKAFAAEGARVALNDISPQNLNLLVDAIQTEGGEAKAYVRDIAKKVPVQGLVMHVEDDFGKIDILINHSAVEPKKAVLEIDEWDWQRTIMVNLSAAFLMTQSVGRIMKKNDGGVIINLVPLEGRETFTDRTAYVASMMGLIGFTRQVAGELAVDNIRAHAVCTGIPEMHQAQRVFPSSFIDAVLYLCGDDASDLHGEIINIEEKI